MAHYLFVCVFCIVDSPRIIMGPCLIFNVELGQEYRLKCDVIANPAVNNVTWYKGNVLLQGE